jgi:L-aminopeptidase/D-esterase-like protein
LLEFDFPRLEIGVAEYDERPTGCTVFHFPGGASSSIDVRGGSPGVSGAGYELVTAICLAGGSLYGLEAAVGVAAELLAQREWTARPSVGIPYSLLFAGYGRTLGCWQESLLRANGQRSGAGVEPTQPWVTRPHRF